MPIPPDLFGPLGPVLGLLLWVLGFFLLLAILGIAYWIFKQIRSGSFSTNKGSISELMEEIRMLREEIRQLREELRE